MSCKICLPFKIPWMTQTYLYETSRLLWFSLRTVQCSQKSAFWLRHESFSILFDTSSQKGSTYVSRETCINMRKHDASRSLWRSWREFSMAQSRLVQWQHFQRLFPPEPRGGRCASPQKLSKANMKWWNILDFSANLWNYTNIAIIFTEMMGAVPIAPACFHIMWCLSVWGIGEICHPIAPCVYIYIFFQSINGKILDESSNRMIAVRSISPSWRFPETKASSSTNSFGFRSHGSPGVAMYQCERYPRSLTTNCSCH